jgi:acetolactate synthase-1/2/3 large subunit
VVIDVPKDTTDPSATYAYEYPKSVSLRSYKPAFEGDSSAVNQAIQALLAAKRPVFYVGGGVVQADAEGVLRDLVKAARVPVTSTLMGLGAYPGTDEQSLGMLGMHGTYEANMAMHDADLIFALGARFDDRVTNNPDKFSPKATIVHLDVDPASVDKIIHSDITLIGDAGWVLNALWEAYQARDAERDDDARQKQQQDLEQWWQHINEWRSAHGLNHNLQAQEGQNILPQLAIQSLYRTTKGDAFVTSDVGQHQMFAAQYYHFDEPRRWINSGGLGTMGFGLPSAMGVQMGNPESVVACVTGEGSFMMNMQELSTCLQYGLPIKIINLNNQALGMVKQWQDMQYGGRHSQSTYSDSLPDFKTLVEAFGHVGIKVSDATQLDAAMEEAFSEANKNRLVFVDVWVDPHEHVYPMAIKGGAMNDMILSKSPDAKP